MMVHDFWTVALLHPLVYLYQGYPSHDFLNHPVKINNITTIQQIPANAEYLLFLA